MSKDGDPDGIFGVRKVALRRHLGFQLERNKSKMESNVHKVRLMRHKVVIMAEVSITNRVTVALILSGKRHDVTMNSVMPFQHSTGQRS